MAARTLRSRAILILQGSPIAMASDAVLQHTHSAAWEDGLEPGSRIRGAVFCQLNRPGHEQLVCEPIRSSSRATASIRLSNCETSSPYIQKKEPHCPTAEPVKRFAAGFFLSEHPEPAVFCGRFRAMTNLGDHRHHEPKPYLLGAQHSISTSQPYRPSGAYKHAIHAELIDHRLRATSESPTPTAPACLIGTERASAGAGPRAGIWITSIGLGHSRANVRCLHLATSFKPSTWRRGALNLEDRGITAGPDPQWNRFVVRGGEISTPGLARAVSPACRASHLRAGSWPACRPAWPLWPP